MTLIKRQASSNLLKKYPTNPPKTAQNNPTVTNDETANCATTSVGRSWVNSPGRGAPTTWGMTMMTTPAIRITAFVPNTSKPRLMAVAIAVAIHHS